ncbi:hypothetical protein E4U55_006237 [Claviceps digitariae]|nr:hypothetical protein E4U55_006237 [Claviceps digitariae]
MVSSCKVSHKIRGYNSPSVQKRSRRIDSSIKLYGASKDSQSTNAMSDGEKADDTGPQRKRIAVACGRCRQRKIRCSGDNGNGESCTNCKNAGAEPCQFLRVSSQEVQGVRPTSFNYNIALSRKLANRHAGPSPTFPSSSSPYAQAVMATVGHGDAADQHEMPYGCVPKHYDQVHGWAQGYSSDHSMDYNAPQSTLPINEHLYLMGSYRSGHPVVVRNNVVYVDSDAPSYGYGSESTAGASLDPRSTSLPDPSHSYQNGMSCYSNTTVDHPGRCMSISDRSRSTSSSHAEGLIDRRTPPLTPAMDGTNMVEMNGSYHGYDSVACSSPMDRSSGLYTTTPPNELLVHGGSLRGSLPDYTYRYAETTPERGGQTNGGSIMAMEDAQYFPPTRGCYVSGNSLGTTNNGVNDSRGTSLAGLHG